jgi:hypothetical protein
LGVIIGRQLNFRGHVEHVNKKIGKSTNYEGRCLEQEKNYCLN